MFTRAPLLVPILSQMNPVHTIPSYFHKFNFNTVLSPTSISFYRFLSFGFTTKLLYAFLFALMRATRLVHLILLDLIILIIFGEKYEIFHTHPI
jgi:hypothetical protein